MNTSRIGPFAIEERLGGSDTSVFRAIHIQQRRSVALKVFPAPLVSNDTQAKAALVQEIEKLKALQHPHIARCYGGILNESQGCLAYELVEGESLSQILARRGRLSWETVVDYAIQLSQALDYAHQAGLVHQDLTPEKLMVTPNEQLKIIDFRDDRTNNSTCISSNKRTASRVLYLSPEQLRGESELTPKSDLYSLGCLMFHMLSGEPPFPGETAEEVAQQQLENEAPRIGARVMDCPVWLESLIEQLLHKEPSQRPHGAAAVNLALLETHRQVAAKTGVVEHAAGGFSPLPRQVDQSMARDLLRKARREQYAKPKTESAPLFERPWFLALCLLMLVAGVATWLLWPVNEGKLLARAKAVMAQEDGILREDARPTLVRLLDSFPNGQHAQEAQMLLDELDMASAERRLRIRARLGKPPQSEAERHFVEAFKFEQFGDHLTALDKYQSMVDLLPHEGDDRAFVNLARRQIASLEKDEAPADRLRFVQQRMAEAELLASEGKRVQARKIWNGIVTLYGNNREFTVQVQQALEHLRGDQPGPPAGEERQGSAKD